MLTGANSNRLTPDSNQQTPNCNCGGHQLACKGYPDLNALLHPVPAEERSPPCPAPCRQLWDPHAAVPNFAQQNQIRPPVAWVHDNLLGIASLRDHRLVDLHPIWQ